MKKESIVMKFDDVKIYLKNIRLVCTSSTRAKTMVGIISLMFIFNSLEIYGQKSELKFKYITVDQGLSSNRVFCIYRDSRQFLWIGTDMGLNRYDGYQTTRYLHHDNEKGSLSDNTLRCINEDAEGNLLIGTSNGMNLYDRASDSFTTFSYLSSNSNSISSGNINSMYLDKKSNFWVLAGGNCLNKWLPKQKKFIRYYFKKDDKAFYNATQSIAEDSKGNIWVVSFGRGIYCLKPGADKLITFQSKEIDFSDNTAKNIYIDEQDIIWITSNGGGFHSFDPSTGKAEHYYTNENGKGTNKPLLRWIVGEDNRYLLIAVNQGGINRFDKLAKTFEYITYSGDNESGLNNNGVWSLYKDKEGILWVGTGNGGVNYYNPKEYNFKLFRHNNSTQSPSGNTIGGFYEDAEGIIWIATDGEGVNVFDPKTKTFKVYKHDPRNAFSISGNTIRNIQEDKDKNVWIGTWDDGLNKYDRKTAKFHRYMPVKNDPSSISGTKVWNIKRDYTGLLWLAIMDKGIDIFDKDKGVIKRYKIDADNPEAGYVIWQFIEEQPKYMWVCSWKGLYRFDRGTGKFKAFKNFPDNDIRTFYKDSKGNYWAGSFNKGLFQVDFDGKVIKVYNDKNGLPNNQIHAIVEDTHGNLWISTNLGISMFNPEKATFKNYSKSDGLQGNQFFTLSFLKTRSNEIYFGGFDGFNAFHPEDLKLNQTVPPIYFTSFEIFNKPVSIGKPGSPLQSNITGVKQITLPWNQSVFSFGFTAINYTFAQKNQYAYKLENFDKDWNYVGTIRSATYTNLDPGEYTFRVKASNNDGIWNEQGASVKITITPPYWLTWWFKILAVLTIAGAAVGFYRYRVSAINKQKLNLQQQVQEQTHQLLKSTKEEQKARKEAEQANSDLEIKNKEMEQFAYIASHDLQEPLRTTSSFVKLLQKQYAGQLDERADKYFNFITDASDRMKVLIKNLLDYSRIGNKKELEKVDCNKTLQEVLADLGAAIDHSKADIQHHTLPVISGYPTEIKQLFQNLIINAVKFQKKGVSPQILISILKTNGQWEFAFKDNGIGIEKNNSEKIFNIFQRLHTRSEYEGTGIGLSYCKKIVELHKGKIWLESEPGEGTTFYFTIPQNLN
ncbi:MAG: two-component regulator propeller domain-containing protein [Ginsengibacter sp.]